MGQAPQQRINETRDKSGEVVFVKHERNDGLFHMGRSLRAKGLSGKAIEKALIAMNETQCLPPLPEHEVIATAKSAAKKPAGGSMQKTEFPVFPEGEAAAMPPPLDDAAFDALLEGDLAYNPINFGYERNDSGNAQRLIDAYGENMRYCAPWQKWLVWDERRWEEGAQHAVVRFATDVAAQMLQEAKAVPKSEDKDTEKERLAALGFAIASGNDKRLDAMIKIARSGHQIPVEPERFDKDVFLLNCANGTLDLKKGDLRPFRRGDYITKFISASYDPEAKCPLWERFLYHIMGKNPRLVDYLRRAFGYSLTGDIGEQCLFILHGDGANGKSTMLGVIRSILGSYARQAAPETFMEKKNASEAGYDLAVLRGIRFVTSIETREGKKLDESVVKQVTGGDPVACRRMKEDFWEYMPEFKVFLATNHRPVIRGVDHGIWRRIRLIPFRVKIPEEDKDKELPEKLMTEAPGILAWAVRGNLEWRSGGLQDPKEVLATTEEYRLEQDILGTFLDEVCLVGPNYWDTSKNIYNAYAKWTKENNLFTLSQIKLARDLADRGFEDYRPSNLRGRKGLTVKPEYEHLRGSFS